jgi:hypothetical protein
MEQPERIDAFRERAAQRAAEEVVEAGARLLYDRLHTNIDHCVPRHDGGTTHPGEHPAERLAGCQGFRQVEEVERREGVVKALATPEVLLCVAYMKATDKAGPQRLEQETT